MKFEELPENWNTLPLDDGRLAAGVIDLVMGYRDRLRHSLLVLPCDEYDVPLPTPMLFGDVDWSEPGPARREKLQFLPQVPAAGFVVALSARRRLPANLVRCWLRTFEDTLDASGQALLAFGVAHMNGVEIVGGRAVHNGSLGAEAG